MDSEYCAKQERLTDKLKSVRMWSYFKERPVIITYALLSLSFILVITLFAVVHSNRIPSESKQLATKDDILGVNITVNSLNDKIKEIKKSVKKATSCDSGWLIFGSNCYFFTNSKVNWHKARSNCVSKNADLVIIENEEEQKFISGHTVNMPYWIGLNDMEEEGKWTWLGNIHKYETSFKSWMPGEPKNNDKEDCAQVLKAGNWKENSCHNSDSFAICEKKL
ncbi:plasmacytoid dendritic cell antigen processing and presentation [Pristimantis euphronides]